LILRLTTLYQERRQELVRFIKFCVVGTVGTIINFALFNLFFRVVFRQQYLLHPNLEDLYLVVSTVASNGAAVVNNYTWSRFWVYPETKHQGGRRKFVQFVIVSLVAIGLQAGIVWVAERWFLGKSGLFGGLVASIAEMVNVEHIALSSNGALVIATGIVLFWNFFANRMWTFKDVDHVQKADAESVEQAPAS
jgi:putative flippase GtrA